MVWLGCLIGDGFGSRRLGEIELGERCVIVRRDQR